MVAREAKLFMYVSAAFFKMLLLVVTNGMAFLEVFQENAKNNSAQVGQKLKITSTPIQTDIKNQSIWY